ncbi:MULTISPECIES: hypothetical protein [unclassified Rathayibacter]|uniref:hypothetical protein n=1 Tax=unclassified Rathayibacter TaxID=2609250 RepID=UPI0006FDB2F6|nr:MULTISPECIES: hypothetical protein [unclassified Rathayibacter]KQQ06095.1 hypothetical protein ASF42_06125 [Rathayibacter sp. Leaf294]KQS13952.1 hypothetical protein ASG06_06135 [Rathayibacter sp. Leaf185]
MRNGIAATGVALATLASLALSGCATEPVSSAVVGIGRGGQYGQVLGVVVVCSGSVDGLDLATEDRAPLIIGDGQRRITRWVSPEAVTELGATDLVGRTVWPADTVIDRFAPGIDYSLGAYADGRSMSVRPVVFTSDQFDTLSVGEIIVGDIRDGTSETLSVENFLGLACQPA